MGHITWQSTLFSFSERALSMSFIKCLYVDFANTNRIAIIIHADNIATVLWCIFCGTYSDCIQCNLFPVELFTHSIYKQIYECTTSQQCSALYDQTRSLWTNNHRNQCQFFDELSQLVCKLLKYTSIEFASMCECHVQVFLVRYCIFKSLHLNLVVQTGNMIQCIDDCSILPDTYQNPKWN